MIAEKISGACSRKMMFLIFPATVNSILFIIIVHPSFAFNPIFLPPPFSKFNGFILFMFGFYI